MYKESPIIYDGYVEITVKYPWDVDKNNPITFDITYKTHDLIERVGKVVNIYLPGYPKKMQTILNDKISGTTTKYEYSTQISIPKQMGKIIVLQKNIHF